MVAFDRAGFGWSEHSPAPQDAGQSAKELHTALRQAGIPGPYVLAGHSYGGLLARVFAAAYPDEVAGLVLVDPRHGDQANRYPPEGLAADRAAEQFMRYAPVLARLGILRLGTYFRDVASDLPARQAAEVTAFEASAKLFDALRVQGRSLNVTDAQSLAAGPLGARPLVVLSAGTAWLSVGAPADATRRAYTAMNIEQAGLSSNSVHRVVEGASHMSLVHRHDDAQATVTAIREVVEAAQSGQPLAR